MTLEINFPGFYHDTNKNQTPQNRFWTHGDDATVQIDRVVTETLKRRFRVRVVSSRHKRDDNFHETGAKYTVKKKENNNFIFLKRLRR